MAKEKPDSGHSFKDYFKRATSQMVVLKLLSEKPMYVYQISSELAARTNNGYAMSFLYPVLYRLQTLGYVREDKKEISQDNRVRNYYCITEEGRSYLASLTTEFYEMVAVVKEFLDSDQIPAGGENE